MTLVGGMGETSGEGEEGWEAAYREFFRSVASQEPYGYQLKVGRALAEGRNIVLRAPTGAGKTRAVLVPFYSPLWEQRPGRLIYALPLRTLAQGIYGEARDLAVLARRPVVAQEDGHGREVVSPYVTLQTGEQPDDPFFDRGAVIVTTYDQLLSGLLCGPYGLSGRLHNVNAAAIAGSLVVFDESHLMEPQRAFLTAAAALHLFRGLCQSVWMTATATEPLVEVLRDALGVEEVPSTAAERREMHAALPSVVCVERSLTVEGEPLSADAVLRHATDRSIVLLNTVDRAQSMYVELRERLARDGSGTPLILLHSRFFTRDRRAKEARLRGLFGRDARGPAILVATQVVEAGLDLSCDHLHTEICPMNALVQRAGRCARFPGEKGVVHVYPLAPVDRAWLPYGDEKQEDSTLSRTREVLEGTRRVEVQPELVSDWVQEVHGGEDARALREGWRSRLGTCLGRIQQTAILRDPKRVADLIRGDEDDAVRAIISDEARRPDVPGRREGLSLTRGRLARLVHEKGADAGWYWDGADGAWKGLASAGALWSTYAVCLRPAVAAYDADAGLRLGIAGNEESPPRTEPRRPGYAPLRAESWSGHARRVAEEAKRRLAREGMAGGLLGTGLQVRYGLSRAGVEEAVAACGLLHDFGKLGASWQRWAEAAQRSGDAGYRHATALAHTDFDPDKAGDVQRMRSLGVARPAHAAASAYCGRALIGNLLPSVAGEGRADVASACLAAVLAHHGGWWSADIELHPPNLWAGWQASVTEALGWAPQEAELRGLRRYRMEKLLHATTGAEALAEWWPLVAYLTRTLRLADQRATAEGALDE